MTSSNSPRNIVESSSRPLWQDDPRRQAQFAACLLTNAIVGTRKPGSEMTVTHQGGTPLCEEIGLMAMAWQTVHSSLPKPSTRPETGNHEGTNEGRHGQAGTEGQNTTPKRIKSQRRTHRPERISAGLVGLHFDIPLQSPFPKGERELPLNGSAWSTRKGSESWQPISLTSPGGERTGTAIRSPFMTRKTPSNGQRPDTVQCEERDPGGAHPIDVRSHPNQIRTRARTYRPSRPVSGADVDRNNSDDSPDSSARTTRTLVTRTAAPPQIQSPRTLGDRGPHGAPNAGIEGSPDAVVPKNVGAVTSRSPGPQAPAAENEEARTRGGGRNDYPKVGLYLKEIDRQARKKCLRWKWEVTAWWPVLDRQT